MARSISGLVDVLLDRGRFTRTEAIAIAIGSIAFAAFFCCPLISNLSTQGLFDDWDFFLAAQWVAYWTVHQYHQFPLWNPFQCGGVPLLGDPQSHLLTPWFFLTMMFGPVVGAHLQVIVYSAIAWAGGYVLGRVLGMRRISAICTATAFAGSSWFFLRAAEGHVVLLVLVYLPWIIAAGWTASERGKVRYASICAALIAVSFFEGSPYVPLYEGLTLALVLVGQAAVRLSLRPLIALAVAAFFVAGFAAVKYSPATEVMASHPRPTDPGEGGINTVEALGEALLSRDQEHERPNPKEGFWELGAYVGLFAVIALAGLISPRKSLPWIFAGIVLFVLARGLTGPNSLWAWLHTMPLFSSTRVPSRFLIPFTLMVAVLAGFGIDAVCSRGAPAALAASGLLVIIGAVDLIAVGPPNLQYVFRTPGNSAPPRSDFAQFRRLQQQTPVIQSNEGVVNCYNTYSPSASDIRGRNEAGYRGEQYVVGQGSVALVSWTPNRLEYTVDAQTPSLMVVNQNYDPSWRVMSGARQTSSWDGLLAVRVEAGRSRIVLKYISMPAIYGMIISIVTALAAFLLFRWESPRALPPENAVGSIDPKVDSILV